jgi:hypothetical protein
MKDNKDELIGDLKENKVIKVKIKDEDEKSN